MEPRETTEHENTGSTAAAFDEDVDVFPVSFAQQRLWFLNQLDPHTAAYNVAGAVELDGPLDLDALRRALKEIVRRHEALRTRFAVRDGEVVQVVSPIRDSRRSARRPGLRPRSRGCARERPIGRAAERGSAGRSTS